MNTRVNFDIANLIKEKGFDEPCDSWYYNDGSYHDNPTQWINSELGETNCSRPTIADVVMWLYKKHGIWIGVKPSCYGAEWYSEMFTADKQTWDDVDKRHAINSAFRKYKSIHTTPTEAYEEPIKYCLTTLIQENK